MLSWRSWQRVGLIIPRSPVRSRSKATFLLISLGGQDTRLSPESPGFNSRLGNIFLFLSFFLLLFFKKKFPNRELNPGLSGESRVSWPPRLLGRKCFRPGSNRRPWDYETHALPTAPRKHLICRSPAKIYHSTLTYNVSKKKYEVQDAKCLDGRVV